MFPYRGDLVTFHFLVTVDMAGVTYGVTVHSIDGKAGFKEDYRMSTLDGHRWGRA